MKLVLGLLWISAYALRQAGGDLDAHIIHFDPDSFENETGEEVSAFGSYESIFGNQRKWFATQSNSIEIEDTNIGILILRERQLTAPLPKEVREQNLSTRILFISRRRAKMAKKFFERGGIQILVADLGERGLRSKLDSFFHPKGPGEENLREADIYIYEHETGRFDKLTKFLGEYQREYELTTGDYELSAPGLFNWLVDYASGEGVYAGKVSDHAQMDRGSGYHKDEKFQQLHPNSVGTIAR